MTTAGSSDAGDLTDLWAIVQVLRGTPFHQWAPLRARADESLRAVFDEAVRRVRGEWNANDQHAQIKEALTAVATEVILALPGWPCAEQVLVEHLDNASDALDAAHELAPLLRYEPAS